MIVLDASAIVEVLRVTRAGMSIRARLREAETAHAPQLATIEAAHLVRRMAMLGEIDPARGRRMIQQLAQFPYERHGHDLLLDRMWELRGNLSAYDATYVALAEALRAPLLTLDAKLAASPGHRATIELVAA